MAKQKKDPPKCKAEKLPVPLCHVPNPRAHGDAMNVLQRMLSFETLILTKPLKSAQDWILIFVIELKQYNVGSHKIRCVQGTISYFAPFAVEITGGVLEWGSIFRL